MTTITCTVAILLAVLTVPLVLLWRCTLTKQQNINRLRSRGDTWRSIADLYGVSTSTVRRWAS